MKKSIIALSIALTSIVTFAEDTLEAKARIAIDKGLDFLLSVQHENGVFGSPQNPALTAMPAWALSGAGKSSNAVAKAVSFIKSCAQEDGGIYTPVTGRRGGTYGTYNTAICMTSLFYCDPVGSQEILRNARKYVASTQLEGEESNSGGFGYEPRKGGADLNNSAWAISAMALTEYVEEGRKTEEKKVSVNWDKALEYVTSMQTQDGGFIYRKEDPASGRPPLRSYGSITYSGLLSMLFMRVPKDDPRIISAVDYARTHWTLDENPGQGTQGIYFYYTIIARSLSLLDVDVLESKDGKEKIAWRDELLRKVISLQNADGSWKNENNRWFESDPILTTSYAVLALEYALRTFK